MCGRMAWPWFGKSLSEPCDVDYGSGTGEQCSVQNQLQETNTNRKAAGKGEQCSVRNQRIIYEMIFGVISHSVAGGIKLILRVDGD